MIRCNGWSAWVLAAALAAFGAPGLATERSVEIVTRPASQAPSLAGAAGPAEWTVMVYINGDNNLEPFALLDMDEMQRSGIGPNVNLLALVDRAAGYSTERDDWQGTRLYRLQSQPGGKRAWDLLEDLGERNMGDPAMLRSFVSKALEAFPAERYALILWDHGGGWSNLANDEFAPGADGDYDYLTLHEIRSAVKDALDAGGTSRLDLIGFDMCLMAQLETMTALKDVANVMVASQAVEPGDGWPYQQVLRLFDGGEDARQVATGIVESFDAFYERRAEPVYTLSAVDLEKVPVLLDSLDALLAVPDVQADWRNVVKSIYFAESYNDLTDDRRGVNALQSWDLRSVLNNLASVTSGLDRRPEWARFQESFDATVLASKSSNQHKLSRGIAIYAPFRSELLNERWKSTALARESEWDSLLGGAYAREQQSPGSISIEDTVTYNGHRDEAVPDVVQFGQDGFLYRLDVRNALRAISWRGTLGRGGKISLFTKSIFSFHDESMLERTEKRDRLTAVKGYGLPDGEVTIYDRFDGGYLVVTDGESTVNATVDQSDIGAHESGYYLVKVIYDHAKQGRYEGTLRFNWLWEADNLQLAVPQKDGSYSYMNVTPRPDATLHFVTETFDRSGNLRDEIAGSLSWGRGLSLTYAMLAPGDYVDLFGVEDLSGEMAFKRHDFPIVENKNDFVKALRREDMLIDNFVGEWEIIDAGPWFERQQMVSMNGRVVYEKRQGYDNVLDHKTYKGSELISPENFITVIPTSGIAHVRDYVLDEDDEPDQGWGTRVGLPVFDYYQGTYLLLSMDVSDGSLGVWRKISGPEPKLAPVDSSNTSSPAPTGSGTAGSGSSAVRVLEGTWGSQDGTIAVFQGREWATFMFGMQTDGGSFTVQGDVLVTVSAMNGMQTQYRFQTDGQTLYLQDPLGNVYQFYRVE